MNDIDTSRTQTLPTLDIDYHTSAAAQIQRQVSALQQAARPFAEATVTPEEYHGNLGNCMIVLDLAHRMKLPVLSVMQNLQVIDGAPSWSSKFLAALVNNCGRFSPLGYRKQLLGTIVVQFPPDPDSPDAPVAEEEVENWEYVAYATDNTTGKLLESQPVTIEAAVENGWYTAPGSYWPTAPHLMLTYRSAAYWQRMHAPELSMGFRSAEEERDAAALRRVHKVRPASKPAPRRPSSTAMEEAKQKLRDRSTKNQTTT